MITLLKNLATSRLDRWSSVDLTPGSHIQISVMGRAHISEGVTDPIYATTRTTCVGPEEGQELVEIIVDLALGMLEV